MEKKKNIAVPGESACCQVASVVSDSVRLHGLQPTRLLQPWDSPGKNTGVGCYFLLQCRKVESESEVTQSCLTLSNPMDCSLSGSSIHGIFQATVLEWGAIAFSIHSSNPYQNQALLCTKSCPTLRPYGHTTRLLYPWGFSRQEYWSGLPFPTPGDLPDPGIEPESLTSPALAGGFFTSSATWETIP